MPEGPELAYSRDRLKALIEGRSVVDLTVGVSGRYAKTPPAGLDELKSLGGRLLVSEIGTKGKFMWWRLESAADPTPRYMHCTYGMSGGWYTFPTKHTAFVVEYNGSGVAITRDTQRLYFNDPRHFGTIKFVVGEDEHERKLRSLGPCILGGQVTPDLFAEKALGKPARTIAEALMDQTVLSGVGNYIKAEALFRAGVSPWRPVTDLTPEEYVSLCAAVLSVASESYSSQGATISTYRTPDGSKGTTQFDFQIYSRKKCPLGHDVLREETPEGRTSHWCKQCQK